MLLFDSHLLAFAHFCIGLALGSVLYRSDFCLAGILRDVFLFRDFSLLRPLLLAVVLTMFLFLLARLVWGLPLESSPTFGRASLPGLVGGLVFGIGMVLAGGCIVSTLYKMGGGNLANAISFLGIVGGSMLYAEIHPFIRRVEHLSLFSREVSLGQTWPLAGWLIVCASIPLFLLWQRQGKMVVSAAADAYLQPWRAAIVLAGLNLAACFASGWPIGISTAYAKIGAFIEALLVPSHVAQLEYFQTSSLVVQSGDTMLTGGAGPRIDLVFFSEMPLLVGVIAGSFLTALYLREFRVYGLPPARQGLAAFGGGLLLALGARLAGGCNVKYVLGGLPLLSYQAMLFVGGMVVGAWVGARLLPIIFFR